MMILSAVILLVGFIALAGMVGRVSQLATQTTAESQKGILEEVGPFTDALDDGLADLRGGRSVAVTWSGASTLITDAAGGFTPQDVGRHVRGTNVQAATVIDRYVSPTQVHVLPATSGGTGATVDIGQAPISGIAAGTLTVTGTGFFRTPFGTGSPDVGQAVTGTGIPAGARITSVTSATVAIVSPSFTVGAGTVSIGKFGLSSTSTPTLETGVVALMEQLQRLEASRGYFLDYSMVCTNASGTAVPCGAAADCGRSRLDARLSDGEVLVTIRSALAFVRPAACTTLTG